jgi:Spy/CpxP family protein refolding chaperone
MSNHAEMADMSKLTTPERIEKMKEMRGQRMAEMSTSMDQRNEATLAFYNVLTADQKKVFDSHEMAGPGGHAGMRSKRPQMPASN